MKIKVNNYLKFAFSLIGVLFIIGSLFVYLEGIPNTVESIDCSKGMESVLGNDRLKHFEEINKCCYYIIDDNDDIGVKCQ